MSELESHAPSFDSRWLFPRPQRMSATAGWFPLPVQLGLDAGACDLTQWPALRWLEQALEARGHRLQLSPTRPAIQVAAFGTHPLTSAAGASAGQGYAITLGADGVCIAPGGEVGLQHALATLAQLVLAAPAAAGQLLLPCLLIEDWPDLLQRGVLLDISRDKVPTLATLKALIDRVAKLKLNQLQLYMEHTFAYPGHDVVWRDASPLGADEVRELDDYCAARHVELVPNQNSFGHMQRWLRHPEYRALAECPDGFEHPWNWSGEPYGLCATDPASLRFLEGLYDALLPNFRSRQFNVGLDETLDLGAGRSRAACEERGREQVYLEFLRQLHTRVRARGRTMQFWGDIVLQRPELLSALPNDAVVLEWGYEADHPFEQRLQLLRDVQRPFYVCPGTSSWCSIAGRSDNALRNLANAARAGKQAGAQGYLITDWGDHGHLQPLSVSYLGLLAGAGFAWNVADAQEPLAHDWPVLLDRHLFSDSNAGLGRAALELGNAYLHAGSLRPNASVLFWLLIKPERVFDPPGVTQASLQHTLERVERAGESMSQPRSRAQPEGTLQASGPNAPRPEWELEREELSWVRDVLRFACHLGLARWTLADRGQLQQVPAARRGELAGELRPLIARHRSLWLARNRPGGLADSAQRLARILIELEG
ncbi:MAG TPA: family 20 glycosylhydrolase [Polyangiales bacterium]